MMQRLDNTPSAPVRKVFDVADYCRVNAVNEREMRKLILLVGRFASRLEIQMNLTRRPPRFR